MKVLFISTVIALLSINSSDFKSNDNVKFQNNDVEEFIPCGENSVPFFTTCSSGCVTVLVQVVPGPASYYRQPTQSEFDNWRADEQASCPSVFAEANLSLTP